MVVAVRARGVRRYGLYLTVPLLDVVQWAGLVVLQKQSCHLTVNRIKLQRIAAEVEGSSSAVQQKIMSASRQQQWIAAVPIQAGQSCFGWQAGGMSRAGGTAGGMPHCPTWQSASACFTSGSTSLKLCRVTCKPHAMQHMSLPVGQHMQ
jgi:hypothetical protein